MVRYCIPRALAFAIRTVLGRRITGVGPVAHTAIAIGRFTYHDGCPLFTSTQYSIDALAATIHP